MTADEIADAIVEVFNALTDQQFTFKAEKPAEVAAVEQELTELGVFVIPKDEQEEAIGDLSDTCRRTRIVSVALNGPIRSDRTLAMYCKQHEALRESLEGTTFSNYRWDKNEVQSLWDHEALRLKKRFLALFEATYYTFS